MSPLRIGVIGLGVIAQYYLAAIEALPGLRLAAVCDLRPEPVAAVAGQPARFLDHRTMLSAGLVDAVVVTVPNDAHHAVCRDALDRGIPVCVEKPLATTMADALDLDRLARRAAAPLFTAFHRRYNDNLHTLLSKMDGVRPVAVAVRYLERIEDHVGVDDWYLDPDRCGGGCVADNGPNAFDLVRLLLGEVTVTSAGIARDARGTDRRAVIELESTNGATGRVELDWSHPGETKDVTVRLADGRTLTADLLHGHPEFKGSLWHEYHRIVAEFTDLVRTGRPAGDAGVAALALVEQAYRVERTGTWVPAEGVS